MKINNLKNFTAAFLTICAVVFGLTTLANAAVNPELISKSAHEKARTATPSSSNSVWRTTNPCLPPLFRKNQR
jgi:hypothetical protein